MTKILKWWYGYKKDQTSYTKTFKDGSVITITYSKSPVTKNK